MFSPHERIDWDEDMRSSEADQYSILSGSTLEDAKVEKRRETVLDQVGEIVKNEDVVQI